MYILNNKDRKLRIYNHESNWQSITTKKKRIKGEKHYQKQNSISNLNTSNIQSNYNTYKRNKKKKLIIKNF